MGSIPSLGRIFRTMVPTILPKAVIHPTTIRPYRDISGYFTSLKRAKARVSGKL